MELHQDPRKILIIKPSALGDVVHSLPFLAAIRTCFPDAQIHWVIAKGLHELLEDHPMIDKLWIINKDQWKQASELVNTVKELKTLYHELKQEKFDMAVDLQGLLRSGIIAVATRARLRLGFKEAREGSNIFYTHKLRGGREIHAIERYLRVAAFLGCNTNDLHFPFPPLLLNPSIAKALPKDYVVIAPSAGKEANRWPTERFGELASRLPLKSVVVSSRADTLLALQVAERSRGKAISLGGKTNLRELIAVIKGARFFVSNDTGPMHIAAGCNVPVFAIFGPANPVRTGPYGNIHTIIREDLSCSPCYRKKKCKDWVCIEAITVERVYQVIRERMKLML
jgi:lipopolysaccharide heptosyltransferase I